MEKKELNKVALSMDEMAKVFGGANAMDADLESQVLATCTQLKKMGKTQQFAINLFNQMMPDHPEIETYINSVWESIVV